MAVVDIVNEINSKLQEHGYCVNVYYRRRKYYLVDQVEKQKKTFKKLIAFARAIYTYWRYTSDIKIVHLVFEKMDDLKIQDMAVFKNITNMVRHVTANSNRSALTRKVLICEKCMCAFTTKSVYENHIHIRF